MRVILQAKVANLGDVGDAVTVKPGYGRNYLLPQGKAVPATAEYIAEFEEKRVELEKKAAEVLAFAEQRAKKIEQLEIKISAQASEEGKLFGSIGPRDVAVAISEKGVEIHKSEVNLPTGPIRMTGEYEINLQLHSDVTVTIKIKVEAE